MDTTLSVDAGTVAGADGAPVAVSQPTSSSIVQTTAANADWTLHRFTFIPDTTTTATITFGNHLGGGQGDGDGVFLDMVSAQVTTYTMTYAGNGNTSGIVPVDANPYADSATVTVLGNTGALAKTGSTFDGWNTQADGLGTSYAAADPLTITADTTLYAKWTAVGGGFDSWATTNGVTGGVNGDSNNDGVQNGIAYFMDATGLATNPGLDASNTVTWPNGGNIAETEYGTDKQFVVQTSTDLVNWTPVDAADLTTNTSGPAGELTYTLPPDEPGGKLFVRLVVTPN